MMLPCVPPSPLTTTWPLSCDGSPARRAALQAGRERRSARRAPSATTDGLHRGPEFRDLSARPSPRDQPGPGPPPRGGARRRRDRAKAGTAQVIVVDVNLLIYAVTGGHHTTKGAPLVVVGAGRSGDRRPALVDHARLRAPDHQPPGLHTSAQHGPGVRPPRSLDLAPSRRPRRADAAAPAPGPRVAPDRWHRRQPGHGRPSGRHRHRARSSRRCRRHFTLAISRLSQQPPAGAHEIDARSSTTRNTSCAASRLLSVEHQPVRFRKIIVTSHESRSLPSTSG